MSGSSKRRAQLYKGDTVRVFGADVMACAAWYVALHHASVLMYCMLYIVFESALIHAAGLHPFYTTQPFDIQSISTTTLESPRAVLDTTKELQ